MISLAEDNNDNLDIDMCSSATAITLQDYLLLKMIGKGGFGKVFLVQHKDTKEYLAMKCMRKDEILEYD